MSANSHYKTPINELPKRSNNGRKRSLYTKSEQISKEDIKNKIESLSDKELQSLYITTCILMCDMISEMKDQKRENFKN